ncbi:DUF4180 domain-containing protein [Kitasatospora sp. GP82]|uniref:DUF4180 domain-containing protein n=1 Tax=Kitasatospora sp. GP82 TaxID=3035089 RepID=UPI002473AE89|nr:DUF4180 domain-containing protein [Kitasatospora sp. GP82]MDH6126442.1 hypothetical protein [Kitasatospora sp. GP82]
MAGEIVQKFVTYRVGLVVLGDISGHVAAGSAPRDFARESNRSTQLWLCPDTDDLANRLRAVNGTPHE